MSVKCPVSIRKFPDGCFWIVDADGERIADDGSSSGEYAETMSMDTARRIVACVNAMAGIGEDNALFHPSKNALTVRSVISSMKIKQLGLEQQRDDLLVCLKWMVALHESQPGLSSGVEYCASLNAIAKAEGATPPAQLHGKTIAELQQDGYLGRTE